MTTKGRRARAQPAKAAPTGRLKKLRLDLVYPNPQQPRKDFDETKLAELAASIQTHGLLQPIRVRPDSVGTYMVICGERRYRAHLLAGLKEITAHVDGVDDQSLFEQSIVENLQRVDITPLEEAHAFKACLEMSGGEPAALAARLGLKQPWRIDERLSLLALRDDYQAMLARGTLGPSQAYEMSRLPPPLQDELLRLIKAGACDSYNRLRASAEGLLQRDKQGELLGAHGSTDRRGAGRALRPGTPCRKTVRAADQELQRQGDGPREEDQPLPRRGDRRANQAHPEAPFCNGEDVAGHGNRDGGGWGRDIDIRRELK